MNDANAQHPFKGLIPADRLENFCTQDFETRPVTFANAPIGRADFSLRDFYTILRDTLWSDSNLHLVPNGEHRTSPQLRAKMLDKEGQFTLDCIRATRMSKATIVVNAINRMHPGVRAMITQINASGLYLAKANAYFTPAGAQGFLTHWDRHDVFVLQISGAKEWHIATAADIDEPLERPEFLTTENYQLREKTTQVLAAGQMLYIPRGVGHYAVAMERDSLHLTISVQTLYWGNLLKQAVDDLILSTPELRRSLAGADAQISGASLSRVSEETFAHVLRQLDNLDLKAQIAKEIKQRAKDAAQGQMFGATLDDLLAGQSDEGA